MECSLAGAALTIVTMSGGNTAAEAVPRRATRRRGRRFGLRLALATLLLGGTGATLAEGARRVLPPAGEIAVGVRFDGELVGRGVDAGTLVAARAEALLGREVVLRRGDRELLRTTLGGLGASVDVHRATRELWSVGRSGSLAERLDAAWEARHHRVAVSLPRVVPVDAVALALADEKERFDHKPRPARWDFAKERVVPHEDGEILDVYAAVDGLEAALDAAPRSDETITVEVPVLRQEPLATTAAVESMDRSTRFSRFETVFGFVGNQVGRAQNIARAAEGIDGVVMMPSEVISFNALVGPRSPENGFAEAGEIYKGEMRMGIGGGTCQVASTYHAAAYLGGLEVVARSPHSRPSGYIRIGLDATVAYPHVDLRLRNPFPFPVLVHAFVRDRGTLVVELYGREQPVTVAFDAATVGVKTYKRTVRVAHWLEEGRIIRKQAGRKGVTIQKIRTMRFGDGTERVEETLDHYPPTTEIYYVPVGTDVATELPPLPQEG